MKPDNFSTMRNEAVSNETAYSLGENKDSPSLERLNYSAKLRENQRKACEKLEASDHQNADDELEKSLSSLNIFVNEKETQEVKNRALDVNNNLSTEQKIKNYTESIKDGKSPQEILRLLIAKFENEKGIDKLLSNFKNFLKLHQFAESKPPKERKAIQKIISDADFSSSNSFETSISQISQSTEISQETKFEVIKQFSGGHIDSVGGMDYQLRQVKEHSKAIENEISIKSHEKDSLDFEIDELKQELDELPFNDPKRQELEAEIENKKEVLEQTENEINRLEKGKPKETSFALREGYNSVLNPDGSRSIKIMDNDFSIKLPSNKWLFSDKKNMRAINLAFPYMALKNENLTGFLFRPNLENNAVPSKSQRDMGHLILSSLGFNDAKILSKENINQLKKDLSILKPQAGSTAEENLIELGVFNVYSRSLDLSKLKKVLTVIRENRGVQKGVF